MSAVPGRRSGELRVLQAAASIGDGRPVDLFALGGGLDRRAPRPRARRHRARRQQSHEHRHITSDEDGIPHLGDRLPPLVAWPARD